MTLWVNKVGPYNNPQETYNYYSLPFCKLSENPPHRWGGLGEVLGGNELIDSQIEIKFLSNVVYSFIYFLSICTLRIVINWYILARIWYSLDWIMIDVLVNGKQYLILKFNLGVRHVPCLKPQLTPPQSQ